MQFLENENRIYIPDPNGGDDIAEITYTRIGSDRMSIDHTYVNPDYRGQKIADKLFTLLIDKMKQENRQAIPICSYAIKQFERHPELQSLRAE